LLILVVFLAAFAYWFTRDSYPVTRLIPAGQKYTITCPDLLTGRNRIARSAVWDALPESAKVRQVPELLGRELELPAGLPGPVPDWVVNNLLHGDLYLTGKDLTRMDDVLVLTKMSRIGKLLEWLHLFVPDIERDDAGGLGLRRLTELDLYYAVRGRVLALSPSRNVLVASLALHPEESVGEEALTASLGAPGREDVRGTFRFDEADPVGAVFENAGFALRIDEFKARAKWRAKLRPSFQERWSALLDGLRPRQLGAPPDGMIEISADFGQPVQAVWASVGEGLGRSRDIWPGIDDQLIQTFSASKWQEWTEGSPDEEVGLGRFMAAVLGPLGPGTRVSLCDVDLNEMFPLPEAAGTFDVDGDAMASVVQRLPEPPEDAMAWASYPRYDADSKRLRLPMIGGPALEPTVAPVANGLLVSTSRRAADAVLSSEATADALPDPGNLYVRVRPYPCVEKVVDAGGLLVEMGCLRGHTRESYGAATAQWLAMAANLESVSALAAVQDGELTLDVNLSCNRGN
jgi:hypothetical protein